MPPDVEGEEDAGSGIVFGRNEETERSITIVECCDRLFFFDLKLCRL